MEVKVFKTAIEVCNSVASLLSGIAACGRADIALSGGSTPQLLFRIMAEKYKDTDWSNLRFFWGDERMVPMESPESNYGVFCRTLVSKGIISENNVFPIKYHKDELQSLTETDKMIREEVPFAGAFPQFDLIILGIGEDGHTASVFPDNMESFVSPYIVELVSHPQTRQRRITLTGSTINNAKKVVFLCTGATKKTILHEIIYQKNTSLPATKVTPVGDLFFYIDEEAVK